MRGTLSLRLVAGFAIALVVTVVPSFVARADHESGGSIPILEQTRAVQEGAGGIAFVGRKPEEIHQALRDLWRSDPLFMQPDDSEISYDATTAAPARAAAAPRELALSSRP